MLEGTREFFIRFLSSVESKFPAGKSIHAILDNCATHKHPKVLAWLARIPAGLSTSPRTSASWLNAVENFFSKITRQPIRRGVFRSIVDLQSAIKRYLEEYNADLKLFVWTKSADTILRKLSAVPVSGSDCRFPQ